VTTVIEIRGKRDAAIRHTDKPERVAEERIRTVRDREEFADSKIRIMPDAHAGMGSTMVTAMTGSDKAVPNMVGADIGRGMETAKLRERDIDFAELDGLIRRKVTSGLEIREKERELNDEIDLSAPRRLARVNPHRARKSLGTLGGGNRFIEIDVNDAGDPYLAVHSGSWHLGTEVAKHYRNEAFRNPGRAGKKTLEKAMAALKAEGRGGEIPELMKRARNEKPPDIPKDLARVTGSLFDDRAGDMRIVQFFAAPNRGAMTEVMMSGTGLSETDRFTTVHNRIDADSLALRKGAVSAKLGERLLIPVNTRDGSLIRVGKGNEDRNESAPRGAGRLMGRSEAMKKLSGDEYAESMNGVFTASVGPETPDESPMAHKPMDEIAANVAPTADIIERSRPVRDFKAGE
jgi:RNA-splicing ligase RtcB